MNTQDHKQALPPGFRLGSYRVVRVLGAGGFGVTYLCEHGGLGVAVAVKEYLPNDIAVRSGNAVAPKSTADREGYRWGLSRFLDEARTLARFEHRNVVRVRDFFEANGTAYIVMDYEDGEPLDSVLERTGTLTEAQIKRLLLPIVAGLRQMHAAGFLHRDVKPANIFIRRSDESPVLLDFGSARQALGRLSRSVTAIASSGYSPPEQYESDGEQGPWTDIYALSALCYRAITGRAPVEATRRQSRLLRGEDDPLPSLADIARGRCSQAFLAAVDRGLRVVAGERQGSLDEWWAELEGRTIGQQTSHLVSPSPRSGSKAVHEGPNRSRNRAERQPGPRRGVRAAWLFAGVTATVTVATLLYFAMFEGSASSGETAEQDPDAKSWFMETLDRYLLRAAAELGDADAQLKLGAIYFNGDGVAQDHQQAVAWYRKAAGQGLADAQFFLGAMYRFGIGVPEYDQRRAVAWFRMAAEQGHELAEDSLRWMYVSLCSEYGEAVDEDSQETLLWCGKAAEQGDASAQSALGHMYYSGEGVAQDYEQAAVWFRKAADQGNVLAQSTLGVMYGRGEGVAQDYQQAATWFRRAAEQGDATAQANLGRTYFDGTGVAQDYRQAATWYRKAAEQGVATAQADLGAMYFTGMGIAQDHRQAVVWFRKAAEQRNAHAQHNLGLAYRKGVGVAEDDQQAVLWYRKAAEQGLADAQLSLAWMYVEGEGVAKDASQGALWYRKAAEQGDARAQNNLGAMYARGDGVPKDVTGAYAWYNLAAAQGVRPANENRLRIREVMTPSQIAEAQRLSRELADAIEARKAQ